MTVNETLVEALREEGWGFAEACESVESLIDEFMRSAEKKTIVHTAMRTFVLRKKAPARNSGCSGSGSSFGVPGCEVCTGPTLCTKCQRRQT